MRVKKLANRSISYFYEVPTKYRKNSDCPVHSEPLGQDLAVAITRAKELNGVLDAWRSGEDSGPARGSVSWLIRDYRDNAKFKKLAPKTQRGYDQALKLLEEYKLASGKLLGSTQISHLKPRHADIIYEGIRYADGRQRLATANSVMRVARLLWKYAYRRGYAESNPFERMELKGTGGRTRPARRDEVELFVVKADEFGHPSVALAVMLAFELCQRQGDVIGTIAWSSYKPGIEIAIHQHKTGSLVALPLCNDEGPLYPELIERLEETPKRGALIVMRDAPDPRTGKYLPYKEDHFRHLFRRIADAAGLPKDFKFMALRHGGLTELGDAGATDQEMMALSGHKTRDMLRLYSKKSTFQAANAARKRRILIGKIRN